MAVLKSKKKKLSDKAEKNTTIVRKIGNAEPFENKEGNPLDKTVKTSPHSCAVVGMSKGVTKNMGDFESLRVDVWLSDSVNEGETPEEAMQRVESFLDEALEKAVSNVIDE